MREYLIPMVPGPVKVPEEVLAVYHNNFGSPDLEPEFLDLYNSTEHKLKQVLNTENKVVIHTGEGMIALWAALKSCLTQGDKVFSISTGVFGSGIAEMARSIGAEVKLKEYPFDQTVSNFEELEREIAEFNPKMITAVHCETPSSTLNTIAEIGEIKERLGVPLLYVDAVASVAGAPVFTDEWYVDLLLGGSQKCLSVPPSMSFLSVSQKAWEIINEVSYAGYDALKPFQTAQERFYFPYTPYWHGVAALNAALDLILVEGLENVIHRHAEVAEFTRRHIQEMEMELFVSPESNPSPTVTGVKIPFDWDWDTLDAKFRSQGLVVGGSYGPMAGKVFRLGHMGYQADMGLVSSALDVIYNVIKKG
ncbi:MAG: alanine--glyoxylate aminotransferase family protein [Anaerolineales bacterium]|nr:alanine--glyoxylate aminotransferase family protein [Anaerolineales bacterium]